MRLLPLRHIRITKITIMLNIMDIIPSQDMDLRQFIIRQLMHLIMKYILIIMCPFLTMSTRWPITIMKSPIHLYPIMIMPFLILLCPTMNMKLFITIVPLLLLSSPSCILAVMLSLLMDLRQYLFTMKLFIMTQFLFTMMLFIMNLSLRMDLLWNLVTSYILHLNLDMDLQQFMLHLHRDMDLQQFMLSIMNQNQHMDLLLTMLLLNIMVIMGLLKFTKHLNIPSITVSMDPLKYTMSTVNMSDPMERFMRFMNTLSKTMPMATMKLSNM